MGISLSETQKHYMLKAGMPVLPATCSGNVTVNVIVSVTIALLLDSALCRRDGENRKENLLWRIVILVNKLFSSFVIWNPAAIISPKPLVAVVANKIINPVSNKSGHQNKSI